MTVHGRRFSWLVALAVLPALIVAVLGVWTEARRPPRPLVWETTTRYLAGLTPERPDADYDFARHYNWLAAEYTAQSFTAVVAGNEFAGAVATRLQKQGLPATRAQVGAALQVAPPDSFKLTVRAQADTAAGAAALADAVAAELADNGNAYWPQLVGNREPPVRRLDASAPAPVAVGASPSPYEWPARFALAALAGLVLAFGAARLDPFLRPANVSGLGLPVLALIPRSGP